MYWIMCSRKSANGMHSCRERHCVSLREQSPQKLPWIQSHFPLSVLAMLSLLCWILRGAPDPNNELPFQSQMSFPCEQMNVTETRSVNKSWTSDNTMIPSLDGRHCAVEGEQIQSMREQEQMVYCSSIWMNLSGIMLSERSQSQKATHCIIHVCVKFAKTESQWWRAEGRFPVAGWRRRWVVQRSLTVSEACACIKITELWQWKEGARGRVRKRANSFEVGGSLNRFSARGKEEPAPDRAALVLDTPPCC